VSVSLDDIRLGGPRAVAERLATVRDGATAIVNAVTYGDLRTAVAGLRQVESAGRRFLFRTAASFIKAAGGIPDQDLVGSLPPPPGAGPAGLVVVGSWVDKTTRQLRRLLDDELELAPVEAPVDELLDESTCAATVAELARRVDEALASHRTAVLFTSRQRCAGAGGQLVVGQRISAALVQIVRGLRTVPRFVIAKGGITASDVATDALSVRRALVRGQILPGVPLWQLGLESRWPDLPYVVFPGNVGDDDALLRAVTIAVGRGASG
jgi:uncharacterized protein YgbK (DUF1537 family)